MRMRRFIHTVPSPLTFARIAAESGVPVDTTMVRQAYAAFPVTRVKKEDVPGELFRALMSDAPALFFQGLEILGIDIFPEVSRLKGIPQPRSHSGLDVFDHTMKVIENTPREIILRWTAMCHDLGKGLTPRSQWPDFTGHDRLGAMEAAKIARRLDVPGDIAAAGVLAANSHMVAHSATTLRPCTLVRLVRRLEEEFPGGVQYFCKFLLADGGSRKTTEYLCKAAGAMESHKCETACHEIAALNDAE